MRYFVTCVALACAGVCVSSAPAASMSMYVCDAANHLLRVDVPSGDTTVVAQLAVQFTDIAFAPDGRLFGVTSRYVYEVDPDSGWSTLIGPHGFGEPPFNAGIDSLGLGPDQVLYAAGNNILIAIDPQTGAGRRVGSLSGYFSAGDIATDASGRLLLATDAGDLVHVRIDGTGASPVGRIPFTDVYALAAHPAGGLFGIRGNNTLLTLDPATGNATPLAVLKGDDLFGWAWGAAIPPPATEPGTVLLLLLGVAMLRRR